MRNLLRYFLMALVLLVVALVSALTAMRFAIHGREVSVPDLRGRTPAEAHRMAEEIGLTVSLDRSYYSQSVPEGRVLSQIPVAGAVVRRGWEVRLALSLGPQRVAVPQVVGDSERAAGLILAQRGIGTESTAHLIVPGRGAGQVVGQNPPANSTDVAAPKVSLLVEDESPRQAFVMPSFVGQPLGTVTNTLRSAGFVVGKVTVTPGIPPMSDSPAAQTASVPASPLPEGSGSPATNNPSPASIIVSQEPAPGAKILAGSAINFVVK